MNASELFKAGNLTGAFEAQLAEVRAAPGDDRRRLFLFELAVFLGDLDRARRQIDMLTYDIPELQMAVGVYRLALDSEAARRRCLADGAEPQFFLPPVEPVKQRLDALQLIRTGRLQDAAKLLQDVNEAASSLRGEYNGQPFDVLRDADDLFGTVLEVFANGRYFWLPFEQIAGIAKNPPAHPRDLIWAPARLTLKDGTSGDVLLPVLYPKSHEHSDDAIKLGRATDWTSPADGLVRGVGAKTFLIGDDAAALLEWREILLA